MLAHAGVIVTTPSGSARLGGRAVGLRPWQSTPVPAPNSRILRITATPARHGPAGIEAVSGEVTGFVLAYDEQPGGAVYVSGDTVWFEGVAEVARRYAIRAMVPFMGAARIKERGPEALTMTTGDALECARAFPGAVIVPVHYHGWAHFTQGRDDIARAFAGAGLSDRLRLIEPGQCATLGAFDAEAVGTHP
jgi:L-ascorbate metabolism protein UlaG (beta-lactamase superfamily)